MKRFRQTAIAFVVAGLIFCCSEALAKVVYTSIVSCSLSGNKVNDSDFMESSHGSYHQLTLKCSKSSKYGIMGVLRGKPTATTSDSSAVWVMYPALKCSIGITASKRYDTYSFAQNHYGKGNKSNYVSIRLYGNHCDDQRTGCYGSATAVNTN